VTAKWRSTRRRKLLSQLLILHPTLWTRTPSIFYVNLPLSANIEMCLKKKNLTMRTKAILYAICSYHHFFLSATFSLDALKEAATTILSARQARIEVTKLLQLQLT